MFLEFYGGWRLGNEVSLSFGGFGGSEVRFSSVLGGFHRFSSSFMGIGGLETRFPRVLEGLESQK